MSLQQIHSSVFEKKKARKEGEKEEENKERETSLENTKINLRLRPCELIMLLLLNYYACNNYAAGLMSYIVNCSLCRQTELTKARCRHYSNTLYTRS